MNDITRRVVLSWWLIVLIIGTPLLFVGVAWSFYRGQQKIHARVDVRLTDAVKRLERASVQIEDLKVEIGSIRTQLRSVGQMPKPAALK